MSVLLVRLALSVFAILCETGVAKSQPLYLAQQNTPAPPQPNTEPLQREIQNLRAQLQTAKEQINNLEQSLKLERDVNDELMRGRKPDPRRDELMQRLESAGWEFEQVVSELKQISSR